MLRSPHAPLHALTLLMACTATSDEPGLVAGSSSSTSSSTSDPDPTMISPTDGGDETTGTEPATTTTSTTTTSTTSDDSTTLSTATLDDTTGAPLRCGDGIVDPGEICDEGHGSNSNTGSCTLTCEPARCGDGYVWEGHEFCDQSSDNHGEYGGCMPDCTLAPHCGDGELNGPEECDLGVENNGTGEHYLDSVACSLTCYHEALLFFLSSTPFAPTQLASAQGADKRCQELAEASGLYGGAPFMAWISDFYSNPASRFEPAIEGLPYALLNGLRVADDRAALLAEGPEIGITMTETGETLYNKPVWTATNPDGTKLVDNLDCEDWTKDSALWKGGVGNSGVPKADVDAWQTWKNGLHWTQFDAFTCNKTYRLYCVEQ